MLSFGCMFGKSGCTKGRLFSVYLSHDDTSGHDIQALMSRLTGLYHVHEVLGANCIALDLMHELLLSIRAYDSNPLSLLL
jgi:hypothetical protein